MQVKSKVYVICPNDAVTGGPEALHQLVYYLKSLGYDAQIAYYAYSAKHVFCIPNPYKIYISDFILEKDILDNKDNVVILPENAVERRGRFQNTKVYVWWLSVDNNLYRSSLLWKFYYFISLPLRILVNKDYYKKHFVEAILKTICKKSYSFKKEKKGIVHLCASYYAYDYVSKRSRNEVLRCIEPISKLFLTSYEESETIDSVERSDTILYNPRKSGAFIRKLEKYAPDLHFEPLLGLNQSQLIEKYKTAKLYVDFGMFPGAERIPKEAALFGCCVITGRNGASNYYGDVPIPDEYKFANPSKQMEKICEMIREVLKTYEIRKKDFDIYRKTILDLESNFMESLRGILQ